MASTLSLSKGLKMLSKAKRYDPSKGGKTPFFIRGVLLYFLPLPLLLGLFFALLNGSMRSIIGFGFAYGLYLLGATIARKGFLIERAYEKSRLAKAPKLKYKLIGALFLAIATFFTSFFLTQNGLFLSTLLGAILVLGFYLYYGFDPSEDKVGELNIGVSAEEVIEFMDRAKASLQKLKEIKYKLNDTELGKIIDIVINETHEIIEAIEKDPNDLSKARKFFNVYLYRTEKISQEYLKNVENENFDPTIRENYKHLLESVTKTIGEQKERLNEEDITRLDVQIEALTKQLKNEGV